jgi:F-box-like
MKSFPHRANQGASCISCPARSCLTRAWSSEPRTSHRHKVRRISMLASGLDSQSYKAGRHNGGTQLTAEEVRRQQIDARIAVLEREILDLKIERNSISHTARLPPEVLSRIFVAFMRVCPTPSLVPRVSLHSTFINGRTVEWSVLTEVCRRWRDVSLGCYRLWSHITFHKPRWAQLMLQRSKEAPLYIR